MDKQPCPRTCNLGRLLPKILRQRLEASRPHPLGASNVGDVRRDAPLVEPLRHVGEVEDLQGLHDLALLLLDGPHQAALDLNMEGPKASAPKGRRIVHSELHAPGQAQMQRSGAAATRSPYRHKLEISDKMHPKTNR